VNIGENVPCLICIQGNMQLRLDKRQRPYFRCGSCGAFIFPSTTIDGPVRLWGKIGLALRAGDTEAAAEYLRREREHPAAVPFGMPSFAPEAKKGEVVA
jgi:hypothetical protein